MDAAKYILKHYRKVEVPQGDFWDLAFNYNTLQDICRIRESLLKNCASDARIALRAIMMGALHGPVPKSGHFSTGKTSWVQHFLMVSEFRDGSNGSAMTSDALG